MDRKRMTHAGARPVLAVAATLVVAAATTSCTHSVAGSAGHHLEPGLGANFGVTNHTNHTLRVEARFSGPAEVGKPFGSLMSDGQYTIPTGQTVWLDDVNLPASQCVGLALVAYTGTHIVARHPSPLCVNSKAEGGWTITTS